MERGSGSNLLFLWNISPVILGVLSGKIYISSNSATACNILRIPSSYHFKQSCHERQKLYKLYASFIGFYHCFTGSCHAPETGNAKKGMPCGRIRQRYYTGAICRWQHDLGICFQTPVKCSAIITHHTKGKTRPCPRAGFNFRKITKFVTSGDGCAYNRKWFGKEREKEIDLVLYGRLPAGFDTGMRKIAEPVQQGTMIFRIMA
jgi:hypothetical protein